MSAVPPRESRRRFLATFAASAMAGTLARQAHAAPDDADAPFEPQLGRSGKDVMWLPTPDELIDRLLEVAQLGPDDVFVDLGSGDGRVAIAAARDFGADSRGIEYDPRMVEVSQRNAEEAGVADRVRFVQGDIFASDFSEASVVGMYLLPYLNVKLRHVLLAMRPGTRVISYQFDMGRWTPDETTTVNGRPGHLWIVPANAGGHWRLQADALSPSDVELHIEQSFQKIGGRAVLPAFETTLRQPRLEGRRIAFGFTDAEGALCRFEGEVDGERMRGRLRRADGEHAFTAVRQGAAPAFDGAGPATEQEINEAHAKLGSW